MARAVGAGSQRVFCEGGNVLRFTLLTNTLLTLNRPLAGIVV